MQVCDFDSEYEVRQIDSLCYGCNLILNPKCVTTVNNQGQTVVEYNNPDFYTCPSGYTKLDPLPQDIQARAGTKNDNCPSSLDYTFIARNLCTFAQPPMPNEQIIQCCLDQAVQTGIGPPCAKGYCSKNTDPNGGCVSAMTNHCIQNGFDSVCQKFMNITQNQTAREDILQGFFDNQLKNKSLTNNYNSIVASICSNPGYGLGAKCDQLLSNYCTNFTNRQDIFNNQGYLELCGCHLPKSVYIYDDQSCDPLCNFPNVVLDNNQTCQKNVCILEGEIVNSIIQQGSQINITDICGISKNNLCYFDENFLTEIEQYADELKINTNCQKCYTFNAKDKITGQNVKEVKCYGQIIPPPTPGLTTTQKVLIGAGIASAFIILAFFLFLI